MKFYRVTTIAGFIFFSFLSSCQTAEEKDDQINVTETPAPKLPATDLLTGNNSNEVTGFYQGTFPCNDCEGMKHLLLLKKNGTYKQSYTNVDSNKVKSHSTGTWTIRGNQVTLIENNQNKLVFDYINDDLMAISIDEIMIKDPSKYVLVKKSFAGNRPPTEANKGTLFVAHGNEPFWSLKIKNGLISFKLIDWKNDLTAENVHGEKINDSTVYTLMSKGKEWKVAIIDQFCNDGMSDLIYEYVVIVHYQGKEYTGCGVDLKNE